MKKIMILLGLITSLLAAGQSMAAIDRTLECALDTDATNGRKFNSLGYAVNGADIAFQGDEAYLTLVHNDGTTRPLGEDGYAEFDNDTIMISWDGSEHWAELKKDGDLYRGTLAIEEDFAFMVTCREKN